VDVGSAEQATTGFPNELNKAPSSEFCWASNVGPRKPNVNGSDMYMR
jgi:hypothetical protein